MAAPTATVVRDGEPDRHPGARARARRRHRCCAPATCLRRRSPQRGRQLADRGGSADRRVLCPCDKQSAALDGVDLPLGDRTNLVYAGTTVTYGRGRAIVVETGMRDPVRRDRADARRRSSGPRPRSQLNLDQVAVILARAALVVVLARRQPGSSPWPALPRHAAVRYRAGRRRRSRGLARGLSPSRSTLGSQRMVRRNALDSSFAAIETLGQRLGHLLRQDRHADP